MIIATFIIAISFVVFFFIFANIFTPLLIDVPATIKLGRKKILQYKPVLKRYISIIFIHILVASIILILTYYFFIKYSFGFSISIFIGACLALIVTLWKTFWLFFRYSDNHSAWLDFYIKENRQHLDTFDKDVIAKTLNKKHKD